MPDQNLYRILGGEILAAGTEVFAGTTYTASYQPATTPDGTSLSPAKQKDGTAMRNATALEITNHPIYKERDDATESKIFGKANFDSANTYLEYSMRGLMLVALDEINVLRTHAVIGLASITEATFITNIKTKITNEEVTEVQLLE